MNEEMNEALAQEGVATTRFLPPGRTLCMDVGFNSAWRVYSSTVDSYGITAAKALYRGKPFPSWLGCSPLRKAPGNRGARILEFWRIINLNCRLFLCPDILRIDHQRLARA